MVSSSVIGVIGRNQRPLCRKPFMRDRVQKTGVDLRVDYQQLEKLLERVKVSVTMKE
jgi:hypothetical protein